MGFKKVVVTALATVSALSSIAVVSAGAYEWSAKSDDGDGKYIMGARCDVRNRWKVQAASWDKGVYCDLMKDDGKYAVNVWAPQPYTVRVSSTAVDWNGKSYNSSVTNWYNVDTYSRAEVSNWFTSLKSGSFNARYSTRGFELSGSIS